MSNGSRSQGEMMEADAMGDSKVEDPFDSVDLLQRWVDEACSVEDVSLGTRAVDLYHKFVRWCHEEEGVSGAGIPSVVAWRRRLSDMGYHVTRRHGYCYLGMRLLSDNVVEGRGPLPGESPSAQIVATSEQARKNELENLINEITVEEAERQKALKKEYTAKEAPLLGQVLINIEQFSTSGQDHKYEHESREVVSDLNSANAITSRTTASLLKLHEKHKPVLDIDMPVQVIESSTPGHFHLYIDRELSWEQYVRLLTVMAEVGVLEKGYVDSAVRRGYTAVRLPWVKKGE